MDNKMDFESAMERLEAEVKKLEDGNMSLEDALSSYEKAIKLSKICNEKLESAERRVRVLIENADGTVSDSDFNGSNDET